MHEIKTNLYDCRHCSGSGTCRNGEKESSCYACAKRNELPFWRRRRQQGLLCGSCGGIGQAEPLTERMNKRIAPMLAIILVLLLLFMVFFFALTRNEYFSEILAFSSAVIGSVVGFYFSRRARET